jgi:hypothetical protein
MLTFLRNGHLKHSKLQILPDKEAYGHYRRGYLTIHNSVHRHFCKGLLRRFKGSRGIYESYHINYLTRNEKSIEFNYLSVQNLGAKH